MWANVTILIVLFIMVFVYPVIHIWCVKPHKPLKEGLRDWIEESEDDL